MPEDKNNKLILQTNDKPTIFNQDMLLYGILAPVAVAAFVVMPLSLLSPAAASTIASAATYIRYGSMLAGGLLGGAIGKRNIEKANTEGKETPSPSLLNKKMVIGGWLGLVAASLALGAAAVMAGGITVTGAPALAIVAGIAASTVAGGYLGGKMGKKEMAKEYEEAKQQFIVRQLSQNVSPEVGQAVEYTMAHNKDWGKKMLEEKLITAGQPRDQQPGR